MVVAVAAAHLYFVLDFCQGGELFFHLRQRGTFPETWCRFYAAQILLALEAMHELSVVYRDLKPENVLMERDGYLKITDFGLSKQDDALSTVDGTGTLCGTAAYMAPELIESAEHGLGVDWWALGCLLYEMLDGWPPFHAASAMGARDRLPTIFLAGLRFHTDGVNCLLQRSVRRSSRPRRRPTTVSPRRRRVCCQACCARTTGGGLGVGRRDGRRSSGACRGRRC